MPTYPYKCENCDYEYEISLTVTEYESYEPARCDLCNGKMKRKFVAPTVLRAGDEVPPRSMDLDYLRNKGVKE